MAGVNGVPQQLTDMISRFNFLRLGVVTQVDPFFVTLEFTVTTTDEEAEEVTVIRAAYVRQAEPEVGQTVAVMRQGASWFVAGTTSTTDGNAVPNPSFEESVNGAPTGWTLYAISGAPAFQVIENEDAVEGVSVLEVTPSEAATSSNLAYSSAIAVATGQQWELSAYVSGYYPSDNPDTADVELRALWFADGTDLYPTTAAPDTTADTATNIPDESPMGILRGTVTVPAGPAFMRVGLRSALQLTTATHWDFVTARRVG